MLSRFCILLALGLLMVIPRAYGDDQPVPAQKPVALAEIAVPLYKIAERLSSSGIRLTVGPELRETKAVVLIR